MAETTGTATPDMIADQGDEGVRRRDFINIAAVSAAGIGGCGCGLSTGEPDVPFSRRIGGKHNRG